MLDGLKARWQIVLLVAIAIGGGIWTIATAATPTSPSADAPTPSCSVNLNTQGMPIVEWTAFDDVVEISRDGEWLTNAEAPPFVDQASPGGTISYVVAIEDDDLTAKCGSIQVSNRYQCQAQNSIPILECEALVDIMFDAEGVHILNRPDHMPNDDPCGWVSVHCENARIVSLDLDEFGLTSVSGAIGKLTALRVVQLRWNELTQLPPEIGNLANLEALTVRHNRLANLPPEFGQLQSLEHLDLDENEFTTIPEPVLDLSRLRYLQMTGNDVAEVPAGIARLTQLRGLRLLRNEILTLPPEIGLLEQLINLELGSNLLRELPMEMSMLTRLQALDLDSNLLTEVPIAELVGLPSLTYLGLTQNQIGGPIPKEFLVHPTLQFLPLVGNRLEGEVPVEIMETTVQIRLGLQLGCLTTEDPELSAFMTASHPFWQGGC